MKAMQYVPHLLMPVHCPNNLKTVSLSPGALWKVWWFCDPSRHWYDGLYSFSFILHVWEPG